MYEAKTLTRLDHRRIQRYLMQHDPLLATHTQLTQYFLTPTDTTGIYEVTDTGTDMTVAAALYTIMHEKGGAYIHHWFGSIAHLDLVADKLALPTQIFLKEGVEPPAGWTHVLSVTPGMMIDHPVYRTVFSRVAPRFNGAVYTRA
jgi:hypothetical protein